MIDNFYVAIDLIDHQPLLTVHCRWAGATAHKGTRVCDLWLLTPHTTDLRIMLLRIISHSLFSVENTSSHRTYSIILVVVLPVLLPITDLGGIKEI